jgi:hypothetical protein
MASSSGSSPACLRPGFDAGWLLTLLLIVFPAPGLAAPMPDYLRAALTAFNPDVPPGWAYTLTTTRNGVRMVERYNPSLPPAARWTLTEWQGRAPSADELGKYLRSRPQGDSGGTRANFRKDDIEPGSFELAKEDDDSAEFTGRFRDVAAGADKMLGRLTLRLVVDKRTAHVAEYRLTLPEPYSPVLGVKMNQLEVKVRYLAPIDGRPPLPSAHTSRFTGRILFFANEEQLEVAYSDYTPAAAELSR